MSAIEVLPTPEGIDARLVHLPGRLDLYQLEINDNEIVRAQTLGNGATLCWPTELSAHDAIEACLPEDPEGVEVVVRSPSAFEESGEETTVVPGAQALDFLRGHPDTWWVKLRKEGSEDAAIYISPPDEPIEFAVIGPGFNPDANPLFLSVGDVLDNTATPRVVALGSYIVNDLLPRVDTTIGV